MGLLEEYVGYLISLTRKLKGLGICLGECESADYEGVFTLGECLESCLWYVDVMSGGKCVFDLADSDVEEWCVSDGERVTDRENVAESSVDPMSVLDEDEDEDDDEDWGEVIEDGVGSNSEEKLSSLNGLNKDDTVEGYVSIDDMSVDEDGYLYYAGKTEKPVSSETSNENSGIVYVGMEDLVEDEDGYLYYPGSREESDGVAKGYDDVEDSSESDTEDDFPDTDYVEDEDDTSVQGTDEDDLFPEYDSDDGYEEDVDDEENLFPEYESANEVPIEVSEEVSDDLSDDEFPENLDDDLEDTDSDDVDYIDLDEDIPELADEDELGDLDDNTDNDDVDDQGDDDDLFPAEEESWGQDDTTETKVDLDSDDDDLDDDMFPDWGTDEEGDLDSTGFAGSVNSSTTENKSISLDPKNGKNGVRDPAKNGIEIGLKSGGNSDFSLKKAGSGFGESKSFTGETAGKNSGNSSFEIPNKDSRKADNNAGVRNTKPVRTSYENSRLEELERETRLFRNMDKAVNGLLSFARKRNGKGVSKGRNSGVSEE